MAKIKVACFFLGDGVDKRNLQWRIHRGPRGYAPKLMTLDGGWKARLGKRFCGVV